VDQYKFYPFCVISWYENSVNYPFYVIVGVEIVFTVNCQTLQKDGNLFFPNFEEGISELFCKIGSHVQAW
jgi:hypothetical protein